jgi:hypothetical protein
VELIRNNLKITPDLSGFSSVNVSKIRIFFFVILAIPILFVKNAGAVSIGPDCKPKGVVAMSKESWDPKAFWTGQLKEISEYVEGQKVAYRLSLLERRRDHVDKAFTLEEMRTMGVTPASDPQLELALAKTERELAAIDRELLQNAIIWGGKCTQYAQQKLSAIK